MKETRDIANEYEILCLANDGVFSYENIKKCDEAAQLIKEASIVLFVSNGGSNCSCGLHIEEDLVKVANKRALSMSNPGLISCMSNDYGWEQAQVEWLKRFLEPKALLIAISSSGNSPNILNAVEYTNQRSFEVGGDGYGVITFSAHNLDNKLMRLPADIKFHLPTYSYGAAEIYHSLWLHLILDRVVELSK